MICVPSTLLFDMWSTAKSLKCVVSDVVCNRKANRLLEMENSLQKHRQLLLSPLSFPGRNERDCEIVKNAHISAITLPEFPHRVLLSDDVIQESLFVSEMFKLNEFRAVELCLTVESQLSLFPRLGRGVVAVILYYESHLSLIDTLVTLIGARDGRMWSTSMSAEICQAVHSYINELFSEGLLQNILGALRSFSVYNEFSRLENLQVLGDSKHRHDVFMMLKNVSEGLAECVMLWSCQSALSLSEFKLVLDCLLDSTHQEPDTKNNNNQTQLSFQNNGQLTREGLHLLMSLLHCLQPFSSCTCTDQVSDLTDIDDQKSLFENRTTGSDSDRLKLLALIRLAWALCLRRTSHIRAELRRRQTVDVSRSTPYSAVSGNDLATMNWTDFGIGGDEEDELQAALAIESGALEFARKQVLNTPEFEREPLWVYRIHSIITDLIVHMPVRVKEIRLRDEDLLRSTGFDPSTTEHGFANFLLLIAQLYNQPGSRLHGRLALEFWWPVGELANVPPVALGSSDMLSTSITNKSLGPKFNTYGGQSRNAELDNIRQAALIRFLRLAGDMVTTPCLFLPYLRMLHSLCCSRSAAGLCFSLLKANATNPGRGASLITWDHFFNSFRQYLNHMKQMVAQPESNNLRPQISNQLYPHLYFNDGVTPRPRGSVFQRSTAESMCGHRKGLSASDMGLTPSANVQPRSIQPEEQAGLQAVLRLVARICRMDPVARSTFISNPQWQLLPMCMGFLTCPVSLDIKADILYLLTEFCKSQQNIPVIWQHFTSSETDMDEVEPRAEEYPLTNAFLTLMIVMLPKLINYPITMPSNLLKSSTESREWDIASSCLILFDGLINDFLNRLNTATSIITAMMNSNHEKFADHLHSLFTTPADAVPEGVGDGQQHSNTISSSVDWPSYLLNILFQIGREQQIQGRHIHSTTSSLSTSTTSLEALISQLHLPVGWPYSDPGYHLATQLLTDSSLFRMVTGLLEVGLHRHLEFPLPNGPPVGMTRATYAGLSLIRRLLASEDILVTFTTLSTVSIPLPNLPSFGLTILPVCVSRLLMSTNLGSGRADLIPMLLKYCMLVDYLPDHASCAVRILGYLASSIKPHSDLLELLTSDETARNQLLDAFAYLIKWPINSDIISSHLIPIPMNNNLDNEGHFAFTDEWLYGDQDNNELCLYSVGTFSARLSSPAIIAARLDAGFPSQTNTWYFPSQSWERYASYMLNTYFSDCTDVRITHNRLIKNDYYTTAFGDWIYQITANTSSIPISISFLQILLAVMDQPAPNLAHWLCGFRIDSCKAISRSNLQDAGIADQQRTCLHSMLDMIDSASHWLQAITTQPFEFSCTLQWNLALIWQIFYKFGLSSLTSEPLLRFLRGNHDLIAKHLQSDLYEPLLSSNFNGNTCEIFTDRQKAVVEALSLNRKNWILRLYAIEIRVCAMANQRSYVTRLLKLFLGDPSVLVNFMHFLKASEKIINESNLHESKLFNSSVIHELLTKSSIDCPLLTSDSNASKTLSTMIHFKVFLMNLFMKLIISRNDLDSYTNEDLNKLTALTFDQVFDINVSAYHLSTLEIFNASSLTSSITTLPTASALMKQISSLCEWIDTRNMHHLHLYAGKQAATEAWRQAVEISLGLLTNQVQYGSTVQRSISQSMMTSVSSYLHSELMSLLLNSGDVDVVGASSGNISQYKGQQLRPVPVLCLDVLGLLLSQICAVKEVPQTIRLLASGTCLTLCSFLNCQSSIVNSPSKSNTSETALVTNGLVKCAYNKHWSPLLISVMELLVKSIVKTKTSTQRMRANYYGSLCYVIRFCRNLGQSLKDDKIFSADFSSLTECFSVFNPSNSKNTSDSIGLTSSDINQLYSTLITDLIHGHAMIQLTAISLLELLISFDRCSQQLIAYLDKQGTIQHILDTTIDDLNVISKFLTSVSSELQDYPLVQNPSNYLSTELSSNSNNEDYTPSVMSSFLLYQSKMSILCRIGSYLVGAKRIVTLTALDCLYICEDNHHQEQHGIHNYSSNPSSDSNYHQLMDLIWFRSATFQRYSTTLSSSSQYIGVKCDNSVYWDLIELIITGIIEPGHETDEDESAKISWASTLMPTLRLCKIVINTLVQLSSSIVTFLSRQDWSYINHLNSTSNQHSMNSYWLIQWIASETNIVNLFSLIMPFCNSSLNMSCTDEYSNLQREVLQSKILRHTFELLINLITPNNLPLFNEDDDNDTHDNLNRNYKFQNNCLAIEYFFIETQYIQLVYSLLFVLTGYLSTPENRLRKFALDGINSDPISLTRSLFQFFNNSTINPEQENSTPYTKIHNTLSLIVSLLQWSLKCLRSKEKMCLTLFDVQFLNNHKKNLQNSISIEEKHCHHQQQQFGQSVVNLLNCESFNENVSINELKQASSIIFKCPIGISCLHVQLRGLIGIIEQSAFLLWKHLNHLINNPDVLIENSKVPLDQSLQSHRVRNLSTNYNVSPLNSVKRSSTKATPTKRGALMNAINQEQSDNLLQQNSVLLRKHCEHLIQGEIMKMLSHLIKAAYLKQNQRLFIQVMHNRLERIIQKQLNTKLTT
ncbi:Nuclear pore complex protein Nup205 [Schistosoma japonicum]|nr:Nuclear pore complex protein Nup205 [Schistosoma japonicum]